jgi:hypothetical protein
MRDLDPAGGFQQAQKYYTNQNSDFSVKVGSRLNNSTDASQNDSFFSAAQYKSTTTTDGKDVITRVARMRLDLNASYFKIKLLRLRL